MPKIKKPHAFINRIHVRLGFALALVCGLPVTAQAAYANLTPPPGWVQGGGAVVAGPGGAYAAQSMANQWIANAAKSSAMLNAGGRQIAIQTSMKLAANAPRVAASVIFMNPYVRAGVGIAAWLGVAGFVWDQANKQWTKIVEGSDTIVPKYEYRYNFSAWSTIGDACNLAKGSDPNITSWVPFMQNNTDYYSGCNFYGNGFHQGYKSVQSRKIPCPPNTQETPAGCVAKTAKVFPVPREEFETKLPSIPMPDTVPSELPPGTPLPVEQPVINPSPGPNPQPKPLFVPTGDPVPNPKYDPTAPAGPGNQPWKQPGTTVTPRPTPGNPWRVDLQPTDREQDGPDPKTDPDPDKPDTSDPDPDKDKPKPEEAQSLCEKHPDILACAKPELDTPDEDIPKSKRDVTFTEENLFGGGACPADVYFQPSGGLQQMKAWDWNQSCGYITGYVKPILILCCTFTAFMILVPGKTE